MVPAWLPLRWKPEPIRSKARYLGYYFTLEASETPAILSASLNIPHRDLVIRVLKDQGMVHFVVPEERAYYGVATLFGREFISVKSEGQATLTIELGTMTVTVRDNSLVTETNPDGRVKVRQWHTLHRRRDGPGQHAGKNGQ